MANLETSIIAAHRAIPAGIRSAPASAGDLGAFESEFGAIPRSYRWYLENCGGGVVGAEWLDDIRQLGATHRKFKKESAAKNGWTMRDVVVIGWDGAGNPSAFASLRGRSWWRITTSEAFTSSHLRSSAFSRLALESPHRSRDGRRSIGLLRMLNAVH